MAEFHGGQMVVKALEEEGAPHVFSIGGGHISHIYEALKDSDVSLYDTRHEQAAVMMAEAWARLTGQTGVAVVTAGPGFTNALTGVANAQLAGVPLLLIAGVVPAGMVGRLDLQEMDQHSVIKPMVKWSRRVENPERIPAVIHEAMLRARSGKPGPVYVEVPADILGVGVEESFINWGKKLEPAPPAASPEAVRQAVDLLAAAERPIIVAGSGVFFARAGEELKKFVEQSGVPCFTAAMGKGCLPDTHPLCYGPALAIRPGAALAGITQSDCVLLCGTRVNLFYAHGRLFNAQAKIIHVNLDPEETDRNRPADLALIADCRSALSRLEGEARGRLNPDQFAAWRQSLDQAREQSLEAFKPSSHSDKVPIHPARLMREINEFLEPDDALVIDGGDTSVWMNMARTNHRPGGTLESGLFGCLGVGLPFAVAAKLNRPERRVFCVAGDGSLGFNFMELHTALRFKLPIVVVVNNDRAWGMVLHSHELRFGKGRCPGLDLGYVPYHKLVEALGGYGEEVKEPDQIRPALERAARAGACALVNVLTDQEVISPGSVALAAIGQREIPADALAKGPGGY